MAGSIGERLQRKKIRDCGRPLAWVAGHSVKEGRAASLFGYNWRLGAIPEICNNQQQDFG